MAATPIARLRPRQFALALLGLLFLWPAAVNGGPFLFPDTSAYVRGVDAAFVRLTGHATAWSNEDVIRAATASRPGGPASPTAPSAPAGPAGIAVAAPVPVKPVLLGRSIFYGVLLFAGVLAGSLWVAIALQALLAGAVVLGFLRHVADPADERRFALRVAGSMAALATTPLAWFVSMAMPDFLTGLAVAAAAALIAGWRRETWAGRCLWALIAAYAALAHSSHVLILLALAGAGLVAGFVALPAWRPGAAAVALAALVGMLGEAGFSAGVARLTGTAPIRPPFVTARLVEDGPGLDYLRAHCPAAGFRLCRYRDRLPMGSDSFLWGEKQSMGVFMTVPVAEQRALAGEQGAFVRAVVADRPAEVAASSIAAAMRQFGAWGLSEFNYEARDAQNVLARLPPRERATMVASRAYRGTMPNGLATALIPAWSLAGLIAVALACRHRETRAAGAYGAVLAAGWIVDAMACGALSTPHDRYQARVIWVLALGAIALAPVLRRRRAGANAPASIPA